MQECNKQTKQITFSVYDENGETYSITAPLSTEIWIEQLEVFRRFLITQGFFIEKRIAIVEPYDSLGSALTDYFYECIEDCMWQGEVVPKSSISEKE